MRIKIAFSFRLSLLLKIGKSKQDIKIVTLELQISYEIQSSERTRCFKVITEMSICLSIYLVEI